MALKKLDVPYVGQKMNFCGPACLAMAMQYFGKDISQDDIGYEYNAQYFGMSLKDMVQAAEDRGFRAEKHECEGIDFLLRNIDEGNPVIVAQPLNMTNPSGHFRIVIGYDKEDGKIMFHDPEFEANLEFSYRLFDWLWNMAGYKRTALVLKKDLNP